MNEVITQNPMETLDTQFLDTHFMDRRAEFEAVLPSNCSFDRFTRIVKTAALQTPELLAADRVSLFMGCFRAAQDGLLPDGREAALVIYNAKQKNGQYKKMVQYMPMIGGILKKIRNSGELATISAHVVYENDEFNYCLGDDEQITHKPAMSDRGNPICAYTIVKTKDHSIYREVMSVSEIEKIRNLSRAKEASPWREHWAEMAKKTVMRRIAKRLPMSSDLEQVIRRDDEMFEFDSAHSSSEKPTKKLLESINAEIEENYVEEISILEPPVIFEVPPLTKDNLKITQEILIAPKEIAPLPPIEKSVEKELPFISPEELNRYIRGAKAGKVTWKELYAKYRLSEGDKHFITGCGAHILISPN